VRNSKLSLIVAIAVSAALGIGPAFAADLSKPVYTKAPAAIPLANWTGCYGGGNIGAGWQRTAVTDAEAGTQPPLDAGSDTGLGFVGGGQIGCDYQFASNWVVGMQGMFDGASVNGNHLASIAYAGDASEAFSSKVDWFSTLTARLGYAVMPQTLLYVKGGAAWARESYTDVDPSGLVNPPYAGQAAGTRTGWTIGAGGEYLFTPNWSVFAEYNYVDFGSKVFAFNYSCGAACGPAFPDPYHYAEKQNLQTVLVGLNYRFNWGNGSLAAR
jgi:outer membrane immunogenic protein